MPHISKENIADRITELLIEHFNQYATYDPNNGTDYIYQLPYFQKVVRDGRVQIATMPHRTDDERLVLYRSDVKGNEADIDLLNFIYNNYFADDGNGLDISAIQLHIDTSQVPYYNDIATLIVGDTIIDINNGSLTETFYQDNLGQFVDFFETHSKIDIGKAAQILDTHIYELYPSELTKQQRVNRFFQEYKKLKPPSARDFLAVEDLDGNELTDTYNEDNSNVFHGLYDISGKPIDQEEDKYITWREDNEDVDNDEKSLEYLYKELQYNYFVEEDIVPEIVDERPRYRSRSSGYLKVRTLNQAIIVRNEESSDIGLIGPDEYNPIWQDTGFTITQWVRFLDKVNGGTLFNFGNPLREDGATGFMLETFIIERKVGSGQPAYDFFITDDIERFVRLVVRDKEGKIRDSHVGNSWTDQDTERISTEGFSTQDDLDAPYNSSTPANGGVSPFNYTRIPIDLREWYFIVATYDPNIVEDPSAEPGLSNLNDPDFWRWNHDGTNYTPYSGLGAKCKVEIISRTDLLRARGFKE